jgi:hypothetical protein
MEAGTLMSHFKEIERNREIPDSREYVHQACGEVTVISGRDFSHLADPFTLCTGTYCTICRKMVNLKAVAWADTGEPISVYRQRLWEESPRLRTSPLLRVVVPIAGAVLGALLGWLFAPIKPRGLVIGTIMGTVVAVLVVMPLGNRKNRGIDYRAVR